MYNLECTYWKDNDMWIGYLDECRDYMTQGETLQELKENLISIVQELSQDRITKKIRLALEMDWAMKIIKNKVF